MKPYFRAPSKKRLMELMKLSDAQATEVRDLLHGDADPDEHSSVDEWNRNAYHPIPYMDRLLCAVDEVCGTYGVETLGETQDSRFGLYGTPYYEYLNTGETYRTTLIFSHESKTFRLGCWGDIVERGPASRYE